MAEKSYVLITPVRNEEATIEVTIRSVLAQHLLPLEWVIVSDASTDRTDEIVQCYASAHPFIRLLRLEQRPERNFASVVFATESGFKALRTRGYDFVGLLDADIRFQPEYFREIIARFDRDPELGLAGGIAVDVGDSPEDYPKNLQEVPGAVQFFRRDCFAAVQPLIPVPEGGWDALTCAVARMKGYRTRVFPELIVDHLKPRSAFQGNRLMRLWHMGRRDYALGYGLAFELVKCASRIISERPAIIGSLTWFCGYLFASLRRYPRLLPEDLTRFIRGEQRQRLCSLLIPFRSPHPI